MRFALSVLAACTAESRYDLTLDPFVPANLELDAGDPDITLVHRDGARSTLYPLGPASEQTFGDMPPLSDGTVGLLLTSPGTASDRYVPDDLIGYGEGALGGALSGREARSVDLVLTAFGGVGDLGELPRRDAPLFGAAAMDTSGGITTFGGYFDGASLTGIHRVRDVRSGDWRMEAVGELPVIGATTGRVQLAATALQDGRIFVSGGRPEYLSISDNLRSAFIWDPVSASIVWQDNQAMTFGRSQHRSVLLRNGRVLVVGGWLGPNVDGEFGTYQLFDPVELRFLGFGAITGGALGLAVTEAGGDGAVVCGGFSFDFDTEALTPTAACDRITLSGDVLPFPDLPVPVGMAAMAALPDGRLLLAGGVLDVIPIPFEDGFLIGQNVGIATDRAFLYEPDAQAWREVAPLREARAAAVAVPSGDGRVLVVGGAGRAGPMISEDAEPVFCAELFDPEAEDFRIAGACSTPGSGAFPQVSVQPGIGALVVQGHHTDDGDRGGQSYGLLGLAPPL